MCTKAPVYSYLKAVDLVVSVKLSPHTLSYQNSELINLGGFTNVTNLLSAIISLYLFFFTSITINIVVTRKLIIFIAVFYIYRNIFRVKTKMNSAVIIIPNPASTEATIRLQPIGCTSP